MRMLIAFLLLCSPTLAGEMVLPKPVDFPIAALRKAYVATERNANDLSPQSFSQLQGAFRYHVGTDLVVREPDGTIRVLVVGSQPEKGLLAVHDHCWSQDGTKIYYAHVRKHPDVANQTFADLFVVPAAGGEPVQLTDSRNEFSPPSGAWPKVLPFPLAYGVWDAMPCDTPEGIFFASTRNGVKSPGGNVPAHQLFRMDHDGRNVTKIGHMNLGGILHLFYHDGWVYFSTGEHQGLRGGGWGIWRIRPDGTNWQPVISDITPGSSSGWHIFCVFSDNSYGCENYYDTRAIGMPVIIPPFESTPFGPPSPFGHPLGGQNAKLWAGYDRGQTGPSSGNSRSFAFQRHGMYAPLPMMHMTDKFNTSQGDTITDPATVVIQREAGHLSPTPGNGALCSWTGNLAESNPPNRRQWQVCYIPDIAAGKQWMPPTLPPSDDPLDYFVPLLSDPEYQFWYGKAGSSYEAIYGTPPPQPWTFTPSPVATELPDGSPYCIFGTTSVEHPEINIDGKALVPWDVDNVEAMRIVHFNPTQPLEISNRAHHRNGREGFSSVMNERAGFYDQVVYLKKYIKPDGKLHVGPNPPVGSTRLLAPDGKPDSSFRVILPADQPFTFQPINAKGEAIFNGTAKTWHQGRPQELREDCQDCHAHWRPSQKNIKELACYRDDYPLLKLHKVRTVEYHRDLKAIDERLGLGIGPMPWVVPDANSSTNPNWVAYGSERNPILNDARLTAAERLLFAEWQDSGEMAAQYWVTARGMLPTVLITPESGMGPYADNVPPTLCLTFRPDRTLIGACDPQSGLNVASLSIKSSEPMLGRAANAELADLAKRDGDVWTLPGEPNGTITASIRDNQRGLGPDGVLWSEDGNLTRIVRDVTIAPDPPPPPPPPDPELERLKADLEENLRQQELKREEVEALELEEMELRMRIEERETMPPAPQSSRNAGRRLPFAADLSPATSLGAYRAAPPCTEDTRCQPRTFQCRLFAANTALVRRSNLQVFSC